jgi:hypothetical protein
MGWVLVGWSLVGRLWDRSVLGVYSRWLGLELSLRAAAGRVGDAKRGPALKCRLE